MKILRWVLSVMEEGPLPKLYLFFFAFWSNLLIVGAGFITEGFLRSKEEFIGMGIFCILGGIGWLVATGYFYQYRKLSKQVNNVA